MPDIVTMMSRLEELNELLLDMSREYNIKKFYELDRKFSELQAIHKLEDELNKGAI